MRNTRQLLAEPAIAAVSTVANNSGERGAPAADGNAADADSGAAGQPDEDEAAAEATSKKPSAKVRNSDHLSRVATLDKVCAYDA